MLTFISQALLALSSSFFNLCVRHTTKMNAEGSSYVKVADLMNANVIAVSAWELCTIWTRKGFMQKIPWLFHDFESDSMTSKLTAVTGHWLNVLMLHTKFPEFLYFQLSAKNNVGKIWNSTTFPWPKQFFLISMTFPGLVPVVQRTIAIRQMKCVQDFPDNSIICGRVEAYVKFKWGIVWKTCQNR